MAVAILPMLRVGGMQLVRTESSDLSEKILPRAGQVSTAIGLIYLALTVLCALLYYFAGMTLFEATAHAMATLSTGGYSTRDASIGGFSSAPIEAVAIVFMIAGSLPFVVYIQVTNGQLRPLLTDAQVRWFVGLIAVFVLAIAAWLVIVERTVPLQALRHAAFNVVSLISTTGFASSDYALWGAFPVTALFFLMCVGGCTGSTAGGIKIFVPTFNGRPVREGAAISVMAFVFMFGLSFSVFTLLLSIVGLDYLTAMSGAVTALANVGPGLGEIIGPAGNFSTLPDSAKWVLSAAMMLGRLELFTVLVLLTPAFWRS
jgi:trk system potassium uptake protein TrkH